MSAAIEAIERFGNAVQAALLSIHPNDLLPALLEMDEGEKRNLLEFYERHESYRHCAVVHKMMEGYSGEGGAG